MESVYDGAEMLRALIHPQKTGTTDTPDLALYRPAFDFEQTLRVGRLDIPDFAATMQHEITHTKDRFLRADLFRKTEDFEDEVTIYDPASRRFVVQRDAHGEVLTERTSTLSIAYTKAGDRGPLVFFVHGVPTNREQWFPVQKTLSKWCRTIAIDLLGMGESSKPLDMPDEAWDWRYDAVYFKIVIDALVRGVAQHQRSADKLFADARVDEKVFMVADDWGAGPAMHFAELFGDDYLLGTVQQDPIALDGYPVAEIQAFGRLHSIFLSSASDDEKRRQFRGAAGAADQTMAPS